MSRVRSVPVVVGFIVTLALATSIVLPCRADSLYAPKGQGLFSDRRPWQVGDLVTILISENAQATNSTQTSNGKNASATATTKGVGSGTALNASLGLGDAWKDTESTSRKGALVARMTAKVDQILPNGDLQITGTRVLVVNNERQTLTVEGTVRQQDIEPDNSVSSGLIGNAEIRYDGSPDWVKGNVFTTAWDGLKAFFAWIF